MPAVAAALRIASQGDLNSLDPYTIYEGFALGILGNVYEGLVKRAPDLDIQPGLAESRKIVEPTRWRFHARRKDPDRDRPQTP